LNFKKIILVAGGDILSPAESNYLHTEGFIIKRNGLPGGRADLVLLYIDANGRMDNEDAVPRLFEKGKVPVVYILHPDCAEPEKYIAEFPAFGYVLQGSGGPILAASINAALGLSGKGKRALEEKRPREEAALLTDPHQYGLEGEKLFQAFMTNLPAYVFIKDHEGRYLFANEAFKRIGTVNPLERIGRTDEELFPPDFAREIVQNDEKVRQSNAPLETVEKVPYAGDIQTHLVIKFPIPRRDGEPPFLGGIALDITELVQTRNSLEKALEEKSALLQELQHRVKNSLTMITSLIGIEENQASSRQMRSFLRRLKDRVYSIAELYTVLHQTGGVRTIHLDGYLHKEIDNIKQAYFPETPNITIAETLESVTVSVKDAAAYGLIVNELITNAIKHAFPGGISGTIWIDLEKNDGNVAIRVSDDGIGLRAGFDFESGGGSGMLLSRALAEQLGGTLRYEQGGRTVFILEAPLGKSE
jgi:PAS domain S-box-containing protein